MMHPRAKHTKNSFNQLYSVQDASILIDRSERGFEIALQGGGIVHNIMLIVDLLTLLRDKLSHLPDVKRRMRSASWRVKLQAQLAKLGFKMKKGKKKKGNHFHSFIDLPEYCLVVYVPFCGVEERGFVPKDQLLVKIGYDIANLRVLEKSVIRDFYYFQKL